MMSVPSKGEICTVTLMLRFLLCSCVPVAQWCDLTGTIFINHSEVSARQEEFDNRHMKVIIKAFPLLVQTCTVTANSAFIFALSFFKLQNKSISFIPK